MKPAEIKENAAAQLFFPLKQMGRTESIFEDARKGIFKARYHPIMTPILGKQLAVNTYYQNDLIAPANTRISIDLLRIFDGYKINFKVNQYDITDEERDQALDLAMTGIIESKKVFLQALRTVDQPALQNDVRRFIHQTITENTLKAFQDHYEDLKAYLEFANSAITSDTRYIATTAALKKVMDTEKQKFGLGLHEVGETIVHTIKTTWLALLLARQTGDFSEQDYKRLSIICLGHDGGKALVPEQILYKKGRLTQLENDIVKSHVLLSYILSSNNQRNPDYESFVMALHHVRENKKSPQSYSIARDTYTSFYPYLTPEAQVRLNDIYYSTRPFYRIIAIADTFEAITAERVYKKGSSIGQALEIMVHGNRNGESYYPPYLDAFVKLIVNTYLPRHLQFKLSEKLIRDYCPVESERPDRMHLYRKTHRGVIIQSCSNLEQELHCVIYNTKTRKIDRRLDISPLFFLREMSF